MIPFRDRFQQLNILLRNLVPFLLNQNLEFGIFVAEQVSVCSWNLLCVSCSRPSPTPIEPGGTYVRPPSPDPLSREEDNTPYLWYWLPLAILQIKHPLFGLSREIFQRLLLKNTPLSRENGNTHAALFNVHYNKIYGTYLNNLLATLVMISVL